MVKARDVDCRCILFSVVVTRNAMRVPAIPFPGISNNDEAAGYRLRLWTEWAASGFLIQLESEFFGKNERPKKGDFAVKRKRYSVEQIVAILKQAEVGVPVVELIRQAGISEQTFYRWKKHYVGLEVDQVRQLRQVQEENVRLKRLVAELILDKTMLQDVLAKKL
jgi:putative transposase